MSSLKSINKITAQYSISVEFGSLFDHVTSDVLLYRHSKSNVKGQGYSVKTSSDRQITAPFFRKSGSLSLFTTSKF